MTNSHIQSDPFRGISKSAIYISSALMFFYGIINFLKNNTAAGWFFFGGGGLVFVATVLIDISQAQKPKNAACVVTFTCSCGKPEYSPEPYVHGVVRCFPLREYIQ